MHCLILWGLADGFCHSVWTSPSNVEQRSTQSEDCILTTISAAIRTSIKDERDFCRTRKLIKLSVWFEMHYAHLYIHALLFSYAHPSMIH